MAIPFLLKALEIENLNSVFPLAGRFPDGDQPVSGAGHRPANQEEVALRIRLDDLNMTHCHPLIPHMTRHLHPL